MKRLRNLIRYIFIILLNLLIMWLFHSYLNFLIAVGMALFPIYSIWAVKQVKKYVTLEMFLPAEPMTKGAEFHLRFVIHNPTFFPLLNATIRLGMENRFYREYGIHYLNMPVRARKDTEVVYPIVMDYCGRFAVSAASIQLTDLLGVYEVTLPIKEEKECLVFPIGAERKAEAGKLYVRGLSEASESKEKGCDFSEISGIREYIPGDKLQNIHWKLSVKKNELVVKERVNLSAIQLNVLVELANDTDMRLEAVLELADSVTSSLVSQNLFFTVYYYSANLGSLQECYIGNSVEREKWLEMMLYDQSYMEPGVVEEMFKKEYPIATYLYIGFDNGEANSENAMFGNQQTIAVLRK